MESYLDKLNEEQREAVTTTEGPLLVLAGAGSGKTTVLANRIAYILQNRYVEPWNILAITFTNKAAREMKSRIEGIVGNAVNEMWVGTFHSICVRILRRYIHLADYGKDFVIFDTSDSRTVMKDSAKELGLDDKEYPVNYLLREMSRAKNELLSPAELINNYSGDPKLRVVGEAYEKYQNKLKAYNAVDFDDLIMLAVMILRDNEDAAEHYQAQFKYILVDEYQDTNNLQYELVRILASGYGNICVVGDDDQSIYKFRGANVDNILGFENDYSEVRRISLERNYRSTSVILDAANSVIANNTKRLGKNLWTDRKEKVKISVFAGTDEREEAKFIANRIRRQYDESGKYNDCAVLYRTNSQSRAIEEALMQERIPYKVLAGTRFFDRKEIKDITAYLRLIYNTTDDVSLARIINEPKRKIGDATLDKVRAHAAENGTGMFDIITHAELYPDLKSAAVRLTAFAVLIKDLRMAAATLDIERFIKKVIKDSGYMDMLEAENTVEARTRIENIEELINHASEYAEDPDTSGTLADFLESITLRSDVDGYDENDDYVALMTIHSAKGLEFPVVFISGMEEGIFPGLMPGGGDEELEEERRLCYVAITRAKNKLYMTRAMSRFRFGMRTPHRESRFLEEIPHKYLTIDGAAVNRAAEQLQRIGVSVRPEIKDFSGLYKKQKPAAGKFDFKPGEIVVHRKFGEGRVISSQSFGNDAIVVVDFESVGTKRLMAAFAKLERA